MLVLVQINKSMIKILFGVLIFIFSLKISAQNHNSKFEGTLKLDSVWNPIVYLSYIESFNDLNTISTDMIIAESKIDKNGYFSFLLNFLPEEDKLYRLHISKKDAPVASLLIGGNEENHMFLILSKKTKVKIRGYTNQSLFKRIEIKGDNLNQSISKINEIASYKDSTDFGASKVKREFLAKEINEKLRFIADSSSHSLVSLYALYRSDFKSNYSVNKEFYSSYINKWEKDSSNYFRAFKKQIPVEKKSKGVIYFAIFLILFIMVFSLNYVNNKKNKFSKRARDLSVQERKVFSLIKQGKSNKEISEECTIELSTVKTHVSNIYSKLNIKSRKEALEIKT